MIMFFLPWWTYVLVGTVTFTGSLAAVWLANRGELGIEQLDESPYPCLVHIRTEDGGTEVWCWRTAGHDGDHGYPALPPLPQRQKSRPLADLCGAQSSDGKCFLIKGHEQSHNYI